MKKKGVGIAKLLLHALAVFLLTLLTQIGGLIYFLTLLAKKLFRFHQKLVLGIFISAYAILSFALVPMVAQLGGRTPLPFSGNLRPLNLMTCFLNRHYVSTELKKNLIDIANKFSEKHPGSSVNYLDANFLFFDGFPLLPHLSHNDGKKVDLAFFYKDRQTGEEVNSAPSFIGYGVFEDPKPNEPDYPEICEKDGFWQYGLLSSMVPQWNKDGFEVDERRTRDLLLMIASNKNVSKIFMEPHLKQRWKLANYGKIRFQGCHSVRHDDHIHFQIF